LSAVGFKAVYSQIQRLRAAAKSSGARSTGRLFWLKNGAYRRPAAHPRFAATAGSRACFACESTKLPAFVARRNYSLTSARAIFWEMYPSTAPMIREITPTMKGFSSEAEVTAPSLLPVKARPATAA
jgi:hypothetical protein